MTTSPLPTALAIGWRCAGIELATLVNIEIDLPNWNARVTDPSFETDAACWQVEHFARIV